jgi:hypothetical protein
MSELRVIHSEPVIAEGMIDILEEALVRAKSGELSSLAICYATRDGMTGRGWSQTPNMALMAGAIAVLQAKFMKSWLKDNE